LVRVYASEHRGPLGFSPFKVTSTPLGVNAAVAVSVEKHPFPGKEKEGEEAERLATVIGTQSKAPWFGQ